MRRREFLKTTGGVIAASTMPSLWMPASVAHPRQTVLHNGIRLPEPWPPVLADLWSADELPYYIADPPDPIRIDVGRQLFVDDFLIQELDGLVRLFHQAQPHPANPLLSPGPDQVKERTGSDGFPVRTFFAAPYSDGVWWDAYEKRFRCWFLGGTRSLRLAESDDGIQWRRFEGETGDVVLEVPPERDSGTVWIDYLTQNPDERYKTAHFNFLDKKNWVYASRDGVDWPAFDQPVLRTEHYASNPDVPTGDRTTFFLDPFRKKWVWSLRDLMDRRALGGEEFHRIRRYLETDDLLTGSPSLAENVLWLGASDDDFTNRPGHLYNVDGFAYESLMIFLLTVWTGPATIDRSAGTALSKRNQVHLGFSRDGFYHTRPAAGQYAPFLISGPSGQWNEGNVQSTGGGCVVVGPKDQEELLFYYSGRENRILEDGTLERRGHLGLSTLRRDGFASIETDESPGVLTTRSLRFDHPQAFLFVNADVSGSLRVEALDETDAPLPERTLQDSQPLVENSTRARVLWTNRDNLTDLSKRPFRLRFHMQDARLYSFWVTPDLNGNSGGFLAAGGPGYPAYRDEAGVSPTSAGSAVPEPREVELEVFPNPFRNTATVQYSVQDAGRVVIIVTDVLGRTVEALVDRRHNAGRHEIVFDANRLRSGTYFVQLKSAAGTLTQSAVKR